MVVVLVEIVELDTTNNNVVENSVANFFWILYTDLGRLMCNSHYVKQWRLGKLNNFSITQNLWEIDFGNSRKGSEF